MKNSCIVIVGGSSDIGLECAKIWADSSNITNIVLVGRDKEKLKNSTSILKNINAYIHVTSRVLDFFQEDQIKLLVKEIADDFIIEKVLFSVGLLSSGESLKEEKDLLYINGIAPIIFSQALIPYLKEKRGHLAFISSVAGERGRKSNFLYGASKSMMSTYVEGLQHKFKNKEIFITLIKLGPTKTKMLHENSQQILFLAELETVARSIVNAIDKKKSITYVPKKWIFVMFIIRILPQKIFNLFNI